MTLDEFHNRYIVTIGIECHVQLKTATKLFSGADNDARGAEPNTKISPICFGFPGVLPVLNREAVHLAVRAGLAMKATIPRLSRFERKHYFYPDLPLGYQITQLAEPVIVGGTVETRTPDGIAHIVRLHHAHLESDAGKLTHAGERSLVDLNRAGTPLIEIVSEPDMHAPAEAKAYAKTLYQLMTYADVTYGDLYHGNMRFDVNVSVALKGASELGIRTETKNLNSFRSVEKAAEYEMLRQAELLDAGESIRQETRGWNEAKQQTFTQRSKEDAHDYRYFPDPDIPPVIIEPAEIEAICHELPKMPGQYRTEWEELKLDSSVIETLLSHKEFAELIAVILERAGREHAIRIAHWFASSFSSSDDISPEIGNFEADKFIELSEMVSADELSSSAAKEIFTELLSRDISPRVVAEEKNLLQVSDVAAIAEVVEKVLADPASHKAVDDIRSGNDKAIGYLVGQVMKLSQGKANPALAQKLIREKI